jgi:hypothetical protein
MKFLERDLEEIIWNADKELLSERGLTLSGKFKRQLRIGNYGIADIVTFEKPDYDFVNNEKILYGHGRIQVIELKNDSISISAFLQAVRYIKGIKSYLKKRQFNTNDFQYVITLIGRKLDTESDLIYLPDIINTSNISVELYTYKYDFDGITFVEEYGYKLSNEGF